MKPAKLKILRRRSALEQALSGFGVTEFTAIGVAMSRAVDLTPHDMEQLSLYLHNRIAFTKGAIERQQGFLGSLWNKVMREDPNYVWMMGTHLKQVLQLLEIEAPITIESDREYALDLDMVVLALDVLKDWHTGRLDQ